MKVNLGLRGGPLAHTLSNEKHKLGLDRFDVFGVSILGINMAPHVQHRFLVFMSPRVAMIAVLPGRIHSVAQTVADSLPSYTDVYRPPFHTNDVELRFLVGCKPGKPVGA